VAVVGVIVAGVLILMYATVGSLHGKTFTLFVETNEARGVIRGTEVWLNGQRGGLVKSVEFQPDAGDTTRQLLLRLAVLESAREQIRFDSRTQIRSGGSLISSPVIYVHSGTARARGVADGDTLQSEGPTDFETATAKVAGAATEIPVIISDLKTLSSQLTKPDGPVASLRDAAPQFRRVTTQASRVMSRLSSSAGTLGAAFADSVGVMNRARRALAGVDSLRDFLASGRASFGRFRRDTTLQRELASLRSDVANVRALATGTTGSFGRFRADSAYRQSLDGAFRQLDSLIADLRRHPMRYIAF
jgi:phospholipid/cholesterol/gamma-HCH transport system substrate-binding protein